MIIKTIDQADEIVNNNLNLSWDGWDIIYMVQDDYAEYLSIGIFDKKDGKWYKRIVFSYGESGWEIPDSVIS